MNHCMRAVLHVSKDDEELRRMQAQGSNLTYVGRQLEKHLENERVRQYMYSRIQLCVWVEDAKNILAQ